MIILRPMTQHKKYKNGEADQTTVVFPCKVCGKIYIRKSSMYTHLRLCGQEPKYTCVLCGKKFKYKHRLQSHLTSNVHMPRPR
ncbi:gastrula zinc finger protein XlCGF8.2DB-like [Harpegnathos saltator]|uniref:gastrula zinc finger protein XlCGF8.2DB-like n=1 Tax=Harpegnathos saltator TaxID=610380 RepID=UPI000DBEE8BD|nr:gastrula zinc finger protein XlCGF8.2DB-like [Harpegnathos saltator]